MSGVLQMVIFVKERDVRVSVPEVQRMSGVQRMGVRLGSNGEKEM